MKAPMPIIALAVATCLALPATAQDSTPDQGDADDGISLIQRGFGMLMQNLMRDIGPDLDRIGRDMSDSLSRFAPALEDLSVLIDDIGNYTAPERLDNGDIIIRRKADAPPPPPIGEGLRELTRPPEEDTPPSPPTDPLQPEIAL